MASSSVEIGAFVPGSLRQEGHEGAHRAGWWSDIGIDSAGPAAEGEPDRGVATAEAEQQSAIYLAAAAEPGLFIDEFCKIKNPNARGDETLLPFRLWDAQVRVLGLLTTKLLIIMLKARQLGISWLVCAYVLHKCFFSGGHKVLLLSKGKDEAGELLERIVFMYKNLPDYMQALGPKVVKQNTTEVEWDNGSNIQSVAATKEAGRSFTASIVVMDEAAFMVWGDTIYTAVKPTIDAGGQLIILSTANGIGGFFHNMWTKAKAKRNNFVTIFLSWKDRPGRDNAWYRRQLEDSDDPAKVKQEYPLTPEEAFISSGRIRFASEWLDYQAQFHRNPMLDFEIPDSLFDIPGLSLYTFPQPRAEYLIAADVGEGLGHGDRTGCVVLDRSTWDEVAEINGIFEPDVFAHYLCRLGRFYRMAEVFVERNKDGQTVLLQMRTNNYLRIGAGEDGRPGWYTDVRTKSLVINSLAKALSEKACKIRTAAAADEMRIYKRDERGRLSAPEGYFDDRVMYWAIGIHQLTIPSFAAPPQYNYRTGRRAK
jgi:hypothetical protein